MGVAYSTIQESLRTLLRDTVAHTKIQNDDRHFFSEAVENSLQLSQSAIINVRLVNADVAHTTLNTDQYITVAYEVDVVIADFSSKKEASQNRNEIVTQIHGVINANRQFHADVNTAYVAGEIDFDVATDNDNSHIAVAVIPVHVEVYPDFTVTTISELSARTIADWATHSGDRLGAPVNDIYGEWTGTDEERIMIYPLTDIRTLKISRMTNPNGGVFAEVLEILDDVPVSNGYAAMTEIDSGGAGRNGLTSQYMGTDAAGDYKFVVFWKYSNSFSYWSVVTVNKDTFAVTATPRTALSHASIGRYDNLTSACHAQVVDGIGTAKIILGIIDRSASTDYLYLAAMTFEEADNYAGTFGADGYKPSTNDTTGYGMVAGAVSETIGLCNSDEEGYGYEVDWSALTVAFSPKGSLRLTKLDSAAAVNLGDGYFLYFHRNSHVYATIQYQQNDILAGPIWFNKLTTLSNLGSTLGTDAYLGTSVHTEDKKGIAIHLDSDNVVVLMSFASTSEVPSIPHIHAFHVEKSTQTLSLISQYQATVTMHDNRDSFIGKVNDLKALIFIPSFDTEITHAQLINV